MNSMSGEREGGNWEVRRRDAGNGATVTDDKRPNQNGRGDDEDPDEEAEVDCYGAKRGGNSGGKNNRTNRNVIIVGSAAVLMAVFIVIPSLLDLSALFDPEASVSGPDSAPAQLSYPVQDAFQDGQPCSTDELLAFAKDRGIDAGKLQIAFFPCSECEGGFRRGMAAREEIHKGEPLVSAPWSAVISAELSLDSELGEALEAFDTAPISAIDKLTLFLMYHRLRADSPLRAYICMLPHNYTSVPLFWDDRRLLAHGPASEIATRTAAAKLAAVGAYNRLMPLLFQRAPHLFSEHVHTLPVFLWASQTVKSRNWHVRRQRPPEVEYAMLPLGDMINHRLHETGGGRTSPDGTRFELLAGSEYQPGQEVFISYGNQCNMHMLMAYGFEIEGNPVNCTKATGKQMKQNPASVA